MKAIPEGSIDMVLCDLPYGTTQNRWDCVLSCSDLWKQYERIVKENGAILLFGQPPFSSMMIESNRSLFRYEWIWEKTLPQGFLNANRMPLRATENISVFYKKLPTYNPQMEQGTPYNKGVRKANRANGSTNYGNFGESIGINETGKRYPRNILTFSNGNHTEIYHPTQKPVDLLEYLIKTYTNEGETVLDNCMGSGSTGVACKRTGRNFIGIEIEEKYFRIAEERIAKETRQVSMFELI